MHGLAYINTQPVVKINYVLRGTGKAICDGVEEELTSGVFSILSQRFFA